MVFPHILEASINSIDVFWIFIILLDLLFPIITSASKPVFFNLSAKWLDDIESPIKFVKGDFVVIANLLVVVSLVPVKRLEANIKGLSGLNESDLNEEYLYSKYELKPVPPI